MNKNDWHEHDVARVLEQVDPQPSARFHQRMQSQPWMAQTMTTPTHAAPKRTPNRRWMPLAGLLAMMLVVGVVVVTPPLRALAQEVLQLFVRAPKEELTVSELEANAPQLRSGNMDYQLWMRSNAPDLSFGRQALFPKSTTLTKQRMCHLRRW